MPAKPNCSTLSHISTQPPIAITGMSCALARANTPAAVLPLAVWKSILPSPVKIRSACWIVWSKCMASNTISIPRLSVALRKARKAPPMPPAAPAPAMGTILIWYLSSITCANEAIPASKRCTIVVSAPFCGAKTGAAPSLPQKGVSTSHAIVNTDWRRLSGTWVSSMRAISCIVPPQQWSISCSCMS